MILPHNITDENGQTHFAGEWYVKSTSPRVIPIATEDTPVINGGIIPIITINPNTPDDH